ncbi:MAG TPA: aminoglycoside phosphotransferase family protein [Pyrinomonadaceae bacterium]|nr:aminoglycoside phosphotransferase family protein [Pyrinomonadaceae bacterium]
MLRPVSGDAELHQVARVEGGLVNTIYRVTIDGGASYAVRVYAAGSQVFWTERRLLTRLAGRLPVPQILFADACGRRCAYPYLVYQWIEGISLNECRRRNSPETFVKLAEPLGQLLARIAHTTLPAGYIDRKIQVEALLERACEQLREGLARERLGTVLADGLLDCLKRSAPALCALDDVSVLVHGDFGGRNILVSVEESGEWGISGVIDWEEAAAGSALWDVGSLFRYPRRYSAEFRALFEKGYRAEGGELSPDWWPVARTCDAMRLVAILNEERELPGVFAECAELIRSIVSGSRSDDVLINHPT